MVNLTQASPILKLTQPNFTLKYKVGAEMRLLVISTGSHHVLHRSSQVSSLIEGFFWYVEKGASSKNLSLVKVQIVINLKVHIS